MYAISSNSTILSGSIPMDMTDLVRGEGEWRNMQEVIRKTFRLTFSHIERQQEQIDKLTSLTTSLKETLMTRLGEKEVNQLIASHDLTARKSANEELTLISHQVSDLKLDIERKASVRYVDDSLRRKVDKSDMLIRTSAQLSSANQITDIPKLNGEMGKLAMRLENFDKALVDQNERIRAAVSVSEISGIQNQLNQLYSMVQRFPQREEVAKLYEKKVDKKDMEKIMMQKADKATVLSSFSGVERVLAEQEKCITQNRLRIDNLGFTRGDDLNAVGALTDDDLSSQIGYSRARVGEKTGKLGEDDNYDISSGPYLGNDIRDGREEVYIKNIYQRINQLSRELQRLKVESKENMDRFKCTELSVDKEKQDTEIVLGTIMELKKKMDGILTGVIPIKSVESFMHENTTQMEEIKTFLQLPHSKHLRAQLNEVTNSLESVKNVVEEHAVMMSQHGSDLERVVKLEKSFSKSESLLRGVEGITNDLALEMDRVGRLESRMSRSESHSKTFEALLEDKLQFYATEKSMQDQLTKLKISLQTLEHSMHGDESKGTKQLSSIVTGLQAQQFSLESKLDKFRNETETVMQRAIRDITREVISAKRSATSRILLQSSYMNTSSVDDKRDTLSRSVSGDQNVDPQRHQLRSIPFPTATFASPHLHSKPFFSTEEKPDITQIQKEDDDIGEPSESVGEEIRSLDQRLRELQAEKNTLRRKYQY